MAKSLKYPVRSHAVIIGTGLSGLVAGALLAKSGKKVILLPEESSGDLLSGPLRDEEPFFPQALCLGFERDGPVERLFNELGVSITLLKRTQEVFKKQSPFLQVLLPYYRFALFHDPKETLDEFKIGFGQKSQAIKSLYEKSDEMDSLLYPFLYHRSPRYFLQNRERFRQLLNWVVYQFKIFKLGLQNAGEFCKSLKLENEPLDFFNALSVFYVHQTLDRISALEFMKLLLLLKKEPLSLIPGEPALKEILLKIIKENKGEIWQTVPATLNFQKGKIQGIDFKGKDPLGCDVLILNPENGETAKSHEKKMADCYFSLPEEVIPSMMGDFLILKKDPALPFDPYQLLFVSLTRRAHEKGEEKGNKKGKPARGLRVQLLLEPGQSVLSTEDWVKPIGRRLAWIMPFAEDRLEFQKIIVHESCEWAPSFVPKEMLKKARLSQGGPFPIESIGRSVFFLPHDRMNFFINPFMIKRGSDIAHRVKKEHRLTT